ncbi:MAG: sulfatase-like hydrolase/transferase [Clostridiales bacterium]|nr:sulfatase-like hydrolase/transferase [Clostridiales bacterium]
MAKNLIFLVIDSVDQNRLNGSRRRHSPTPFMHKLRENAIWTRRMFSQGPYTEAALTSLLCGNDLMDGGGYLQRIKYKRTVLEEFHRHGYETFVNHFAPQVYPSAMFAGADPMYHQSYYVFREFWDYRFYYYAPLFLSGALSDQEISLVSDMLAENLEAWIEQLALLLKKDPRVDILYRSSSLKDAALELELLRKEYQAFTADPRQYLKELFTKKERHILLKIPKRTCDRRVPAEVQKKVRQRYLPMFKRIEQLNRERNLRNLPYPLRPVASSLLQGNFKEASTYHKMYRAAVWDDDLFARIGKQYTTFRASCSCRSYFEHYLSWYDRRTDPDRPLLTYLHLDDAHTPETFFSWDSSDFSVMDKEMSAIADYLDDLPKSYRGALTSDLSLLYVDGCLRWLFEQLEARGALDDTAVAILADHGFSFWYDPIRNDYWNHFHRELCNPPFLLWEKGRKPDCRKNFYMAKDVAPTLLEVCSLPVPDWMTGSSMLSFEGRDYALHEYMGPGCPDMNRRPVCMGVRTARYLVVVKAHLQKPFSAREICEVYDLRTDPLELRNLVKKLPERQIQKELDILSRRFEALRKNFDEKPNPFNDPDPYGARIKKRP